jgi:hypothetical protein
MVSLPSSALAAGADDSWSGRGVGAATWHQPPEGADAALKDSDPHWHWQAVPQRKPLAWTAIRKRPGAGSIAPWKTGPGRGSTEVPTMAWQDDLRATASWSRQTLSGHRVLLHTLALHWHFYMECELGVYGSRCSWGVGPSKTPFWLAVVPPTLFVSSVQHT